LQTPARRQKLASRHAPHWAALGERGKRIGYRRSSDGEPGMWLARLYVEGRWIQSRLGFADDCEAADGASVFNLLQAKEKALAWFPIARSEATGETPHDGKYNVGDALVAYFKDCRTRMKASNVYRQECAARAHISPSLGGIAIDRLTIGRLQKWMGGLAETPGRKRVPKGTKTQYRQAAEGEDEHRARRDTVNRILTVLKAALNFAVEQHKVPPVYAPVWREVKPFKHSAKARTLFLSPKQQRTFVEACEGNFSELARAGLYSGARYGELRNVRVRNFDTAQGKLYIPPHVAKNKKARHIVLDPEGQQFFSDRVANRAPDEPIFLKDQRKGSARTNHDGNSSNGPRVHPLQWGQSEQARPMREACLRAELEPFPFYTLRHSCAARWLTAGASMKQVADQLGNSVSICERYYGHVSESHSTKVMRAMPPLGLTAQEEQAPRLLRVK
jgi:integrase